MSASNKSNFLSSKLHDWFRDFTSLANPLLLLFVPFTILANYNIKAFYCIAIALLINEIIGSLIKIIFPKTRPNGQTYKGIMQKIDAGSFPSLHSSRISIVYLSLFSLTENSIMQVLFLLVVAIVMLSRVQLKKHFWIDVIGGLAMGVGFWYLLKTYCFSAL